MTKTEIQNLLREHGIIDTVWKLNTPDQLLTPISDWAEHERIVTQIRAIPELRPQLVTTGAWMADGRRFVYAIFKFDGQHE